MFELPPAIQHRIDKEKMKNLAYNPWTFFIFAGVVVILTIAVYIIPNIFLLQSVKAQIVQTEENIATLNMQIDQSQEKRSDIQEEFALFEEKYKPRIDAVFPPVENIGDLTRYLESYALQLDNNGIMTLNNITYAAARNVEDYNTLPVRLAFEADNKNFVRFMQMIKSSGSLEESDFFEGKPVRLLRVDRIDVSIPDFSADGNALYSVNLDMSAFFRVAPQDESE